MAYLLTNDLVRRLDRIDYDYSRRRMEAIRAVSGERAGIEFFESGALWGLIAREVPNPFFHRILGDLSVGPAALARMVAEYAGLPLSIEASPGAMTEATGKALFGMGFAQTGFHPVLLGGLDGLEVGRAAPTVERVKDAEALEAFKDVYVDGWDISSGFAPILRGYMDQWLQVPEWTLYLQRIEGMPAAVGVLHRAGDVAYLADAATAKALRGRGGQSAILRARVEDARDMGCKTLMSRAEFGSTSQHNMERLGLRVAYTRAVWTRA